MAVQFHIPPGSDLVETTRRNALVDLAPVFQALEARKKAAQQELENQRLAERMAMDQKRLGFDEQRLGLEAQRAADARKALDLDILMKRDELGYRGTQRQLNEDAVRAEIAKRKKETEFIGTKPVDQVEDFILDMLRNPRAPGTGTAPGGPAGMPEGIGGHSPGGPAPDPMPRIPGVVVTPPSPQAGMPRPEHPAMADRPAAPSDRPVSPAAAPQPPRDNGTDPIIQTPFGPRTASELDRIIIATELKGKTGLATHLKQIRDEAIKGPNFDKLPEYAAKSAAFATRMIDAEKNIRDAMRENGYDPTGMAAGTIRVMESVLPEGASNVLLRGTDHQRYAQAAEQWIRAFLRKESGAAINKDEFVRDFKVYFPQPGDSEEVVAQKARARLRATQGFTGETRGFHKSVDPRGHDTLNQWLQTAEQNELAGREKRAIVEAARRENPNITPTQLDAIVKERMAPPTKNRERFVPGQQQQPVRVNSPADASKLPSGTKILLPDGREGTVP